MVSLKLFLSAVALLPLVNGSYLTALSQNAQSLFNESMNWMDVSYDSSAGYLFDLSATAALRHESRSSVWYAVGLLARNDGGDVEDALKIITNVVEGQFKDPKDQWYGTYQKYPEEPTVGTVAYPSNIYNSWDPNWRGFVGTTLIIALEEFGHLIPADTTSLIEESLYNATVGDSYRVGGVDNDNLYPAYTNPSLMRAFVSSYTGHRLNDSNMTLSGENYATEILSLFNQFSTLSEFNSGTYTGVSLLALTLWARYLPPNSTMTINAPRMINATWTAVSQLWHPVLKNVAGPWDRSYGFDMNRYLSILGLHLWATIGKESAGFTTPAAILSHSADLAIAPLIAVLSPYLTPLIPAAVIPALTAFTGEHVFTSSCYSPPYDLVPRNITSWLGDRVSIGAESFSQTVVGGPSINQHSFNPAVIQWETGLGQEVGFITLYATVHSLSAVVTPGRLNLTYPAGDEGSSFSLLVGTFKGMRNVGSWADLPGLNVSVTGNVEAEYELTFAGSNGGNWSVINDFEYWNFTYTMPSNLNSPPNLVLDVN